VAGLDDLYKVVDVAPETAFTFAGQEQAFDLADLVPGPDGMPYVLDAATKAVYRIDLQAGKASPVIKEGTKTRGGTVAEPLHLAAGGQDVLGLDAKNVLWRWRPADAKGKGTLAKINVNGSAEWGTDILGIGTFVRNENTGLYNLYVIDPSEKQILRYSPALDGSGYPSPASGYLTTPQDVSQVTSMHIDGDLYLADAGVVTRYINGRSGSWGLAEPPDAVLRPAPAHRLIASPGGRDEGIMYTFDPGSDRILAYDKSSGRYLEQYRIADGGSDWADLRAFYVVARGEGQAPILYWIDGQRLGTTLLQDVSELPPPTPAPSPAPEATPKPTKAP